MTMSTRRNITASLAITALAITPAAWASEYDLSWFTIDGGGGFSAGGNLELEGTIGQPDAGEPLAGGNWELTGGFWPGVIAAPAEPVTIVSAASCLLHDEGGPNETELCIDLAAANGVEPRRGGPRSLAIEVSDEMDGATVVAGNAQIACADQIPGTVTVGLTGPTTITIGLDAPLADVDCCTLAFAGMMSLAGGSLADTVQLVALEGDTDFNGSITGSDPSLIKPHLGEIVGINLSAPQWDFDRSGGVTGGDYALIKPKLGHVAPACP